MRERKLTLWDTITNTHTEVVDNAEKLREGSTTLPSAALLLKLRDDEETFRWLLQNVIAELVGKVNFERKAKSKKISEFVSISHEAFALLFLENYREVVEERAEMPKVERKKGQRREDTTAKGKYTGDGRGARRNGGWSDEGLERYADLFEMVRENRREDATREKGFEIRYQELMKNTTRKCKKKRGLDDDDDDDGINGKKKRIRNPIEDWNEQ